MNRRGDGLELQWLAGAWPFGLSWLVEDLDELRRLVAAAQAGDSGAIDALLRGHADRLSRLVSLRLDRRLGARVGVEDVVQDVLLAAAQALPRLQLSPTTPFYVWLRGIAANKLLEVHRRHLGTHNRDANRDVSLQQQWAGDASSRVLAGRLADTGTSPSGAAMRAELKLQLEAALDLLPAADKEVIALRHFEQLSPAETAAVLGISEKAAGMRYLRAMKRLRDMLAVTPGSPHAWLS